MYKLPERRGGGGGEVIRAMPERKHLFLNEVFPKRKNIIFDHMKGRICLGSSQFWLQKFDQITTRQAVFFAPKLLKWPKIHFLGPSSKFLTPSSQEIQKTMFFLFTAWHRNFQVCVRAFSPIFSPKGIFCAQNASIVKDTIFVGMCGILQSTDHKCCDLSQKTEKIFLPFSYFTKTACPKKRRLNVVQRNCETQPSSSKAE